MEVLFCHEASALFLPTKATIPILKFSCKQKHTYFFHTNLGHWNVSDFLTIFSNQKYGSQGLPCH